MKNMTACHIVLASIAGLAIVSGCDKPDVTVNPAEPSTTTVIHDRPSSTPSTVVVTPPATPAPESHTETHTDTTNTVPAPDSTTPPASSSSTTTTTG